MSATIHYHDIGDYLSREEKLKIIDDFGDIDGIAWQTLTPDKHGDWLNKRNGEFDDYIPLAPEKKFDYLSKSFFTTSAIGVATNRDAWVYGSSYEVVKANMRRMIEFFNDELERVDGDVSKLNLDSKKIAWTVNAKKNIERKNAMVYSPKNIRRALYRPFQKLHLYYDRDLNERPGLWGQLFPLPTSVNKVISLPSHSGFCFSSSRLKGRDAV